MKPCFGPCGIIILSMLLLTCSQLPCHAETDAEGHWWSGELQERLRQHGVSDRWHRALQEAPHGQRPGWRFLLQHMPAEDLRQLPADLLSQNIDYAYRAWHEVPWQQDVPEKIFLNDVLPYCCLDEPRDPWRGEFFARFMPVARASASPAQAARRLNETLFDQLGVRYSTQRARANQSPRESCDSGLASCTGLSILLVDACRAIGVPARIAGIARWPKKPGNHTWVEIWDGKWHFLGAAEPDPRGLDHTWFVEDAAWAEAGSPHHAILAASFAPGERHWPLVWNPESRQVHAVDVTPRYAAQRTPEAHVHRLMIDVRDDAGRRLATSVTVRDRDDATRSWHAISHDETHDTNNLLSITVPQAGRYEVVSRHRLSTARAEVVINEAPERICQLRHPSLDSLDDSLRDRIRRMATGRWCQPEEPPPSGGSPPADGSDPGAGEPLDLDSLLLGADAEIREIIWQVYQQAPMHAALRADNEAHRVRSNGYESPYTIKEVGQRPPSGWPLFVAMHGGGGTTQEMNDSQWRHMQVYYRDQDQLPGYRYLALRAPNNEWNGFYADYVYPLVSRLIQQQILLGEVDPNRVYLMGYSHGGYGAFAIGPKMPDHFAAIHSSAAAPTDGETVPQTLRHTRFTFMIGERDLAYERAPRCQAFDRSVQELRGDRKDIFPVTMEWQDGMGHGGLPDRDKIAEMYAFSRRNTPPDLHWRMSDTVIRDFFWLSCDQPEKGGLIQAHCADNHLVIDLAHCKCLTVWLDSRMVDFHQPIRLSVAGSAGQLEQTLHLQPSLACLCDALVRRGDPFRAFSARLSIIQTEGGLSLRTDGDDGEV